jgi:hypothetical protein
MLLGELVGQWQRLTRTIRSRSTWSLTREENCIYLLHFDLNDSDQFKTEDLGVNSIKSVIGCLHACRSHKLGVIMGA